MAGTDDDAPDLDDLGELGDDEEGTDPSGDEDEGDDEEWKPPTKAEWERAQRKAKRQEDRITRLTGKTPKGKSVDERLAAQLQDGDDEDDEDEGDGKTRSRRRAAPPQDDTKAKRMAGVAALMGVGLTKDQAKSAVRLLDLDAVELDDDGDADLEDEIEDLRERFPALFERTVRYRRPPAPGRRSPDRGTPARTATEQTDEALFRQAGFNRPPTRRARPLASETADERALREAGYR